jgi:hypothetical protein
VATRGLEPCTYTCADGVGQFSVGRAPQRSHRAISHPSRIGRRPQVSNLLLVIQTMCVQFASGLPAKALLGRFFLAATAFMRVASSMPYATTVPALYVATDQQVLPARVMVGARRLLPRPPMLGLPITPNAAQLHQASSKQPMSSHRRISRQLHHTSASAMAFMHAACLIILHYIRGSPPTLLLTAACL